MLWGIALESGRLHPNQILNELSVVEYQELLAYLEYSKYHQMKSWRDNTLGYLAYILTAVNSKGKVDIEKFLPPKQDAVENKLSTQAEIEMGLKHWIATTKAAEGGGRKGK